jgi:hypothetical protein
LTPVFAQAFVEADPEKHDLKGFDCGKPAMNAYLARYAARNRSIGISRTWVLTVAVAEAERPKVAAYYTLAGATVARDAIPTDTSRLPAYPVPVILLARLAVDVSFHGRRLGEKTLITALRKSVEIADAGLGAFGVVLDVLDDDALTFYRRFQAFEPIADDPMRLFVPMGTLRQIRGVG